jgi:hypothetical protein
MDSGLDAGNVNALAYYNNTVAPTTVARIKAALTYLENGGVHWGTTSGGVIGSYVITNRVYYSSRFTNYNVPFDSTMIIGGLKEPENLDEVLPLAEFHRDVLVLGARPGDLEMIYQLRVAQVNALITQAKALRGTAVPAGGNLSQAEYEAAIEKFIADAERDIAIAAALVNNDLLGVRGYADHWAPEMAVEAGSFRFGVDSIYGMAVSVFGLFSINGPGNTLDKRYQNAISFFKNGGYEYGVEIPAFTIPFTAIGIPELSVQVRFKSSFHAEYSGGILGIAANKVNVIPVMEDNLQALKAGNKYLNPFESAKLRYETIRAKLEAIQENPGSILTSNLDSNEDMEALIDDLELIVGSLNDLKELIDAIMTLVDLLGEELVDSFLGTLGMSMEQVYGLVDTYDTIYNTLVDIGIDPTGEISVRESVENKINDVDWLYNTVDTIIGGALWTVDNVILLIKTESTYTTAANLLEGAYDQVMGSETVEQLLGALLGMFDLGPVNEILDVMRPVLKEIKNVVDMVNAAIKMIRDAQELIEEANKLIEEFNFLGLSVTIDKLADVIDDLSDLLEALGRSQLATWALEYISSQLSEEGLNGVISKELAGLINDLVNGYLGTELLNLNGEQLSIVGDFANGLIIRFAEDPAEIVPYLRIATDILRRAAGVSLGLHYILEVEAVQNYDNYILGVSTIINSAYGSEVLNAQQLQQCADHIFAIIESVKVMIEWGDDNLSCENAALLAQKLTVYFAGRMVDCLVNSEPYRMFTNLQAQATEACEIMSFLTCAHGQVIITAQEDEERHISLWGKDLWDYTVPLPSSVFVYEQNAYPDSIYYTTNFDALQGRLSGAFAKMGLFFAYDISAKDDPSFELAANYLTAGALAPDSAYYVTVSYKMYFDLAAGLGFLTNSSLPSNLPYIPVASLATKTVKINLGEPAGPIKNTIYSLMVEEGIASSGGYVKVNGAQAQEEGFSVVGGSAVIVEALPYADYEFVSWSSSHEAGFINASSAATTFIMPEEDTAITPKFKLQGESTPAGLKVSGLVKSYNPKNGMTLQLQGEYITYTGTIDEKPGSGQAEQPFSFEGVEPGAYSLLITKAGHASFTVRNIVVADEDVDLTQDARPEVRLMALRCGDINGDGNINNSDLTMLWSQANYNRSAKDALNPECDLNGDGLINNIDLTILWLAYNYNRGAIVIE